MLYVYLVGYVYSNGDLDSMWSVIKIKGGEKVVPVSGKKNKEEPTGN
jgi:hypothetical protein